MVELGDSANKNSIRFGQQTDSIWFDSPFSKSRHVAVWWSGVLPRQKNYEIPNAYRFVLVHSGDIQQNYTPIKRIKSPPGDIRAWHYIPFNGPIWCGVWEWSDFTLAFAFPLIIFSATPSPPSFQNPSPSSLKSKAVPSRCHRLFDRIIIQFTICWWDWQALYKRSHHHYCTASMPLSLCPASADRCQEIEIECPTVGRCPPSVLLRFKWKCASAWLIYSSFEAW